MRGKIWKRRMREGEKDGKKTKDGKGEKDEREEEDQ